jgi:hypothetical protein
MNEVVKVEVQRTGRRFEAEAVFDLAAEAHTVWETVTDYGALPRFMPGISACRVIERRPLGDGEGDEHLVVEQQGEFRFLMFAQAMTVRLNIENLRLRSTEATAVSFELGLFSRRAIDVFVGRYELEALPTRRGPPRTQLRYTAQIGLRLPPPPAIGTVAVRQNLTTQLEAVAAEIARRSSSAAPTARRR